MENDSYSALLLPHHANSLKKILVAPTQTQFKPTSIKEHLSQMSPPPSTYPSFPVLWGQSQLVASWNPGWK